MPFLTKFKARFFALSLAKILQSAAPAYLEYVFWLVFWLIVYIIYVLMVMVIE